MGKAVDGAAGEKLLMPWLKALMGRGGPARMSRPGGRMSRPIGRLRQGYAGLTTSSRQPK